MKVSVCITVFNEEGSVGRLIKSILNQTKKPDEIVIVDGGSSDKTIDVVRHWQKKDKRIKYTIEPGNVSHGRNTSIELAKNEIIASTDAGCVAKKDWLEKVTHPLKHKNVGIVAGFYEMKAGNSLQKAMNTFHGVTFSEFDPLNFLPSARSVAFKKSVWEKVGGYPEQLNKAGEDTLFFYKIVKENVKIVRVKEARVVWEEPADFTFSDSIDKFYKYAKGDAQAGIWWHPKKRLSSHNIKIASVFARYFVGLALLIFSLNNPNLLYLLSILVILYLLWSFRKVYIKTGDLEAGVWGILVQLASDIAVMSGFISGSFGFRI